MYLGVNIINSCFAEFFFFASIRHYPVTISFTKTSPDGQSKSFKSSP